MQSRGTSCEQGVHQSSEAVRKQQDSEKKRREEEAGQTHEGFSSVSWAFAASGFVVLAAHSRISER